MAKDREGFKRIEKLVARYRVTDGRKFRLSDVDPGDTAGLGAQGKRDAAELLALGTARLADAQDRLYAQDRHSLLLVFQAMDAAGKDGTIKHVMSGVNPQGCQVTSFKQPSALDLAHGYLWRCVRQLPERGRIGIFNRSYYEEVLIVRVHPKLLEAERLPLERLHKGIFKERLEDIAAFERYLAHNGTHVLKFFLHISRKEQKRRFLERLDEPEKNWKFSASDIDERGYWDDYMEAYEDAIRATSSDDAPWYVVPADHKWFTRLVVSASVVQALEGMDLAYPTLEPAQRTRLVAARKRLERE